LCKTVGVEYKMGADGVEGVQIVEDFLRQKKMFDIILMDLFMPRMDGYEAAR